MCSLDNGLKLIILYLPAPQSAFGSSGPMLQALVFGSNISTLLRQCSGRNSRFHFMLIVELPPINIERDKALYTKFKTLLQIY